MAVTSETESLLAPTKPHYLILDGLRGVAAILVVIFHLFEAHFPVMAEHPMHHGYLAVDFFFLLSGFVVGYAYDSRWCKMTVWKFFRIRLVRLHPMVIMGTVIGAMAYWLDPYTDMFSSVPAWKFILAIVLGMLLLPAPDIRGWSETHPINGPAWSLLQEYIANVFYALFGRRMSKTGLWVIVTICAFALIWVANWRGDVATGWSYATFWIAVVRMMFPFFAGLLLFRTGKLLHVPFAFLVCSVILTVLFFMPTFKYNGIYESVVIILAFPLIVSLGAGSHIKGKTAQKICKFFGDISYPIYITHYPFIYIYTMWVAKEHPGVKPSVLIAIGLFVFFIILAYGCLKLFDEPVRAWLKKVQGFRFKVQR